MSLYLVPNEIMQIFVRQTVVMLNAIMFNVDRQNAIKVIFIAEFRKAECRYTKCCFAECRYAKCCFAECPYAKCCYAKCHNANACYAEHYCVECCYVECRADCNCVECH